MFFLIMAFHLWIAQVLGQTIGADGTITPLYLATTPAQTSQKVALYCMDMDPDNNYRLYGGGSYHGDIFGSDSLSDTGDKALIGIKRPTNSMHDPQDWDWLMFLPYPAGPVKGYMIACQFTQTALTTYAGKAIVGFTQMEQQTTGYAYIANPYGNNGQLDLTTYRVKGPIIPLTYRSPYNEIHWQQANKMYLKNHASGTQVDAFIFSEYSSYRRHQIAKVMFDLAGDAITQDTYLTEDFVATMATSNYGQAAGGMVFTDTHLYLAMSFSKTGGGEQYQCILKLTSTDVASVATLNSATPTCFNIPMGADLYYEMGPADYHDKLIASLTQTVKSSSAVASTLLRIVGECDTTTPTFQVIQVDTVINRVMRVISLHAKDSTTNFLALEMELTFAATIAKQFMIFKVHYEPDTSACAVGTQISPTTVTYYTEDFIIPLGSTFYVTGVYYSSTLGAFFYLGHAMKLAFESTATYRKGFASVILESTLDASTNSFTPTLESVTWSTQTNNWIIASTGSVLSKPGMDEPKILTNFTGLLTPATDPCYQKLTLNATTAWVNGYVYESEWITANGQDTDVVPLTDIFTDSSGGSCAIQACTLLSNSWDIATYPNLNASDYYFQTASSFFTVDTTSITITRASIQEGPLTVINCTNGVGHVLSNIFKINIIEHPCNTATITSILPIYEIDLWVDLHVDWASVVTPQAVEPFTHNVSSLVNNTVPDQCPLLNMTTLTLNTSADAVLASATWSSIVSYDDTTKNLTVQDYKDVTFTDFAQVKVGLTGANMLKLFPAQYYQLTINYNNCSNQTISHTGTNYTMDLEYTSFQSYLGEITRPAQTSVKAQEQAVAADFSSPNASCPITDYMLDKVEFKNGSLWTDYSSWITFENATATITVSDYGGVNATDWEELTVYVKAKTNFTVGDSVAVLVIKLVEKFDIEPPPPEEPEFIMPPHYAEPLGPIVLEYEFTSGQSFDASYEYPLPEVKDTSGAEKTTVAMDLGDYNDLLFFDEGAQVLFIDLNKVTKKHLKKGSITVKVLTSNELEVAGEYDLEIQFLNIEPEEEEESEPAFAGVVIPEPEPSPPPPPPPEPVIVQEPPSQDVINLKASVSDINTLGLCKIKFNQKINEAKLRQKVSEVDRARALGIETDPIMDLFMEPGPYEGSDQVDLSTLDFVWGFEDYNDLDNELTIQINYTDAVQISPNMIKDSLVVNFNNPNVFFSLDFDRTFELHDREASDGVKKQIQNTQANKNYDKSTESANNSMSGSFMFTWLLSFVFAGAMKEIIGTILGLQIVLFQALIYVTMPGNIATYYQRLKPIASFNIVAALSRVTEFVFSYDTPMQIKLRSQILTTAQDLNIKFHNSLKNLGNVLFMLIFYFKDFFVLMVSKLLSLVCRKKIKKKMTQKYQTLKKKLFFGELIRFSTGGCIPIAIAVYYQLRQPLNTTFGERFGHLMGQFCFFVAFVFVPAVLVMVIVVPKSWLANPKFKQMFGPAYANIKLDSRWQRGLKLNFVLRRYILLYVGLEMFEVPPIQLVIINIMNAFQIIYIGNTEPFKTRHEFRMELFNEACVSAITYHLFMFTDALPSVTAQYLIGWSLVVTLSLMLFGNAFFVIRGMVKKLWLLAIKKYREFMWKVFKKRDTAKQTAVHTLESGKSPVSPSRTPKTMRNSATVDDILESPVNSERSGLIRKKKQSDFTSISLQKAKPKSPSSKKAKKNKKIDLSVIKEETEDQIDQQPSTYKKRRFDRVQTETLEAEEDGGSVAEIKKSDVDARNKSRIKDDIKKMLFLNIQGDENTKSKFLDLAKMKEEQNWVEHKRQIKAERFKRKRTLRKSRQERDNEEQTPQGPDIFDI